MQAPWIAVLHWVIFFYIWLYVLVCQAHRRTGTFGLGGGGDLLARKNYTMLECVTVDIEILTHLNYKKNESSQFSTETNSFFFRPRMLYDLY